jgi:V8-like Glu-specific endopeptidase
MAGNDLAYPYDTVVRITDTIGGESWQGSGVLISPDEVLTASHVVYIEGEGTATNITVSPGYDNGSSLYGSVSGANFHYFQIDDANRVITNDQSQSDYAVIHLARPFPNIGTMGIESNFSGGTVNVTGYPASAGGAQVTSTQTVSLDPNYTLLDGTSIGDGSSGGPVWVETAAGPEVVGIVSSGAANGAGFDVLITPSVLDQIETWVTQDDGAQTVTAPTQPTSANVSRPFMAGGNSPDILWQNVNGRTSIWEMDGTKVNGGGPIGVNPGPNWTDVATGDFYDDDHSDILWQNANGQVSIWEMNGNSLIGGGPVSTNPGPAWKAVGVGDFYDNGHSDILWQNTNTGQASIWEMNGTSVIGGGPVGPNPGPNWNAIGTGDFYDDGHSDILWQNASTGQVSIWEMDGTNVIGGGSVGNPGSGWTALGTGDFNDDGHSDILLRNANGAAAIWEMNGTKVIDGGTIASNPGQNWTAVGTGDFNNDGHSDILWQNANAGQISIWEMNGITVTGGGQVSPNPGASWRAA